MNPTRSLILHNYHMWYIILQFPVGWSYWFIRTHTCTHSVIFVQKSCWCIIEDDQGIFTHNYLESIIFCDLDFLSAYMPHFAQKWDIQTKSWILYYTLNVLF